jgi:hypothetical protein
MIAWCPTVPESPESTRIVLSVIGPHSGCGKTALVVQLLRRGIGLGCLKISPMHEQRATPPSDHEVLEHGYQFDDAAGLSRAGKDSALYLAAGAVQVERLSHQRDGLALGLEAGLQRFPPGTPVVVESSKAVRLLDPVAVIMVVRPPMRAMKPSTVEVLPLVTDLLVNVSTDGERDVVEARRLRDEFSALRPQHIWAADLVSEPLPEGLVIRLRRLLEPRRFAK